MRRPDDRAAAITRQLAVQPLADLPELALYTAHPGSGLSRLGRVPPYWAYVWAGGAALARHVLDQPELVRGKRVLDFGAGSGVVAIAAARAGAAQVFAAERDPWGRAAVVVNAALNAVEVMLVSGEAMPLVDVVLAGDVFYCAEVAAAVLPVLDRCREQGVRVLVGDPGRADLALGRLILLARHDVRDVGDAPGVTRRTGVYELAPPVR